MAKLEVKFPGLSKVFLGLIAAQMATKVTEESGIDAAIAELDNAPIPITTLATEFQKEGDRRVTEAKKAFEKTNPKPGSPDPDPNKPEPGKEEPEWQKAISALTQQVSLLVKKEQGATIQSKLADKLKDKDGKSKIPVQFYKGRALPEKEEDLDAFITDLEKDYTDFQQDLTNQGLLLVSTPAGGGETGLVKTNGKEEADIIEWTKKNAPPAAVK